MKAYNKKSKPNHTTKCKWTRINRVVILHTRYMKKQYSKYIFLTCIPVVDIMCKYYRTLLQYHTKENRI